MAGAEGLEPPRSSIDRIEPERWLAWAAGFFDGEGCIGVQKARDGRRPNSRMNYLLNIQIGQNDRRPLDEFAHRFGGQAWVRPATGRQRESFYWRATSKVAASVLRALVPYLLVKRQTAEMGLRFYDERPSLPRGRIPLPDGEMFRRELYYLWFRSANRRGVDV